MTPQESTVFLLIVLAAISALAAFVVLVLFLFLARRGCVVPETVRPDDGEYE